MKPVRLAITSGDPAGIGPEIVAAAAKRPPEGVELTILETASASVKPGRPGPESGRAALAAVDKACDLALAGKVDGIVTAPVSKEHITAAGVPFTGHTEHIAGRCGVRKPVMMFSGDRFRVSLVTTHVSISRLPGALTSEAVAETLRRTDEALRRYFGVAEPRIAVCGLNPHAGEGGQFGREESEVIEPGMEMARADGVRSEGPFPADTAFRRKGYDAFIAMFHDQALPVVKTHDFLAVNVTLGLPFVRTSPDHGTAFDIAGQGRADPAPMRRAIELAAQMVRANATLL